MAAAEYFSNVPMVPTLQQQQHGPTPSPESKPPPQSSQPQYFPPPQIRQNSHPPSYQSAHGSPQLQAQRPSVHFADPAQPQRNSFSGQQRPSMSNSPQQSQQQLHRPSYSPQYSHHDPSSHYRPPPPPSQPQPQPPMSTHHNSIRPQNYNYLSPHPAPFAHNNNSTYSLDSGYLSDPEGSRARRRPNRRRDSQETRNIRTRSRSTGTDAILGAAGGGLIGDLIMPGLGTLGGLAIGWLGGKDYGRRRKDREEERIEKQRQWEDRYGRHHSHHGAGDHHRPGSRHDSYGSSDGYYQSSRRKSADDRDWRDDRYG